MKNHIKGLILATVCLSLTSALAQPGGGMGGGRSGAPQISAAMAKLFGENKAFTASVESDIKMQQGQTMSVPGKIAFDSGKTRFEMNMSEAKGSALPPQMAAQMKACGWIP
jgi:uncharacterized protein YdeI (BOF family)